ncbi:hypothetical protein CQA42_01845 [Helicobacter sp. MIT 99-5507]|nr:hypothetical protein CQA42_01845 [Helicobacter sp. MIT 99-5507]
MPRKFCKFSRNDESHAVIAPPLPSLRGSVANEAICNLAYFKDSIAELKADKIMDCHAPQAPLAMTESQVSLRGANAVRDEAIHNTESRNDNVALIDKFFTLSFYILIKIYFYFSCFFCIV